MIKHTNENDFKNDILKDRVLLDFHATWCGPCKMLGKVIEKYEGDIDILKVDIDESGGIADEYDIHVVPTLVMLENGKEVKRISGFMPLDEFTKWVEE